MVRSHQKYSRENLEKAIHAYATGSMTSVEASKTFGVPESTVRNHKRQPSMSLGSGRPFKLQKNDEDHLIKLLLDIERTGFRLTKRRVMKIAEDYIRMLKREPQNVGRHWFHDFVIRNKSTIKFIKEQKLDQSRRDGFTENVRCGWFDTVFHVLQEHNLLDKPAQIFNVDECGFNDDTERELVLVPSEKKIKYEENGGTGKSFTTVIVCVNAKGDMLPPLTVYAAKNVNHIWTIGGPDRASFQCSSNGWINDAIFSFWFIEVFLIETQSLARPVLLVLDGHQCHFTIEVIEAAKRNNVIILCLPPHCTHGLQPLDLVTFAKTTWRKVVSRYFDKTHRKTIRKIDHPILLKKLCDTAFTPKQIVAGFARSGIWPFDRNAMQDKVAKPSSVHISRLTTAISNASLTCNSNLADGDVISSNSDPQPSTTVSIPSKIYQTIQPLDSTSSKTNSVNVEESRQGQWQQQTTDDIFVDSPHQRSIYFINGSDNISSQPASIQTSSASSSGFFIQQSSVRLDDPLFIGDDEQFDIMAFDKSALENPPSFSQFISKGTINSTIRDENENNEDEEFLLNSSSRTYTQLNDITPLSFEVPSFSLISASSSLPSNNKSLDSNQSNKLALTTSLAAAAADKIYKNVLIENQRPPTPPSKSARSRIRQQRKHGEVVTTDEFLDELKDKARKKLTKSTSTTIRGRPRRKTSRNQRKKAPKRTRNKQH